LEPSLCVLTLQVRSSHNCIGIKHATGRLSLFCLSIHRLESETQVCIPVTNWRVQND